MWKKCVGVSKEVLRVYGVSVEGVGGGMKKCVGVSGEVRGEVWKSVLGGGGRYGKVCWGVGGGEKRKCWERCGEVHWQVLGEVCWGVWSSIE